MRIFSSDTMKLLFCRNKISHNLEQSIPFQITKMVTKITKFLKTSPWTLGNCGHWTMDIFHKTTIRRLAGKHSLK